MNYHISVFDEFLIIMRFLEHCGGLESGEKLRGYLKEGPLSGLISCRSVNNTELVYGNETLGRPFHEVPPSVSFRETSCNKFFL